MPDVRKEVESVTLGEIHVIRKKALLRFGRETQSKFGEW